MAEMIPGDQGRLIVVNPPNPAAGADFQFNQPARTRWRIQSIKLIYTASVVVANRFCNIQFISGGLLAVDMSARALMAASEVWTINWFYSGVYVPTIGSFVMAGGMPEKFLINNEMVIGSNTTNMDVSDQISDVVILAEEWIEPLA